MFRHVIYAFLLLLVVYSDGVRAQSEFRVAPYVQNPDFTSISIIWFSESSESGTVIVSDELGFESKDSEPVQATALNYPVWEINTNLDEFPGGVAPPPPYRHRVRFEDLQWDKRYDYIVMQGHELFASSFRTPPGILQPIKFAVYGDSETEPESDSAAVLWSDPTGRVPNREYLIDQTTGYDNNLAILRDGNFDFVAIVGDLVQSGGEQRDWDRFWRHNVNLNPDSSLGGSVPIYAVPGNHEYYATPHRGSNEPRSKAYRQPFSEDAMAKYSTYFEAPTNGTKDAREGRYYRFNYGPVAMIAVDVCNNGLNGLSDDTNYHLLGEDDADGGAAPSFAPGTPQYSWLETQLADAQQVSPFTFVLMHYTPYSVGPHGQPPGGGAGRDSLSGVPIQELTPLFQQYGVDAVFAGHDEMWERSVVAGTEVLPGGGERDHEIHFFDVGVGGDGLRGSIGGLDNPFQQFLVHTDVPETWNVAQLIDGGKHYGHLEVSVGRTGPAAWEATLTPVYAFPLFDESGTVYLGFERRVYDDVVVLHSEDELSILSDDLETPGQVRLDVSEVYPNPTSRDAFLRVSVATQTHVAITAFDVLGRRVREILDRRLPEGSHHIEWDGRSDRGNRVPPGLYVIRVTTPLGATDRLVTVVDLGL